MKISLRISYEYFDDLVGEFRPRRPFSRFFVSRLYSLDDMETGGFKLSPLANISLFAFTYAECTTNIPARTITMALKNTNYKVTSCPADVKLCFRILVISR